MYPSDNDSDQEIREWDSFDGATRPVCSECGIALTLEEYQDFEDTCKDCIEGNTAGIINDNPYRKLK